MRTEYEEEKLICADCESEIPEGGIYLKQTDGTVLCESCFKERIWVN